jgi:hypothetical protein
LIGLPGALTKGVADYLWFDDVRQARRLETKLRA